MTRFVTPALMLFLLAGCAPSVQATRYTWEGGQDQLNATHTVCLGTAAREASRIPYFPGSGYAYNRAFLTSYKDCMESAGYRKIGESDQVRLTLEWNEKREVWEVVSPCGTMTQTCAWWKGLHGKF
jgi:hypothetical protein